MKTMQEINSSSSPGQSAPSMLYETALRHYRRGEHAPAMAALYQALEGAPSDPMLWNLAAATAKAMGKAEDAEKFWGTAIALKPDFAEAHYNLGVLMQERKRNDDAMTAYCNALAHDPRHVLALNNSGTLLQQNHQLDEAMASYRKAIAADPRHAESHHNLGLALEAAGKLEEALKCFEQAIAIDHKYASAHQNRGLALKALGRLDEAYDSFAQAVRCASDKASYYRSLAYCKVFEPDDPHLKEMEQLAEHIEELSPEAQFELHFALGKVYEDIGEREKSFRHYVAGNAGKRRTLEYDEAHELDYFRRIKRVMTANLIASRAGMGDPSRVPIFIVGMPRSGTSLIEQILASHPQVHGAGECEDLAELCAALQHPDGRPYFPDDIGLLSSDSLRQVGTEYVRRLQAKPTSKPGAARITDKMPHNFLRVGFIHMILPNARIIHARRDPVDTCLSGFSKLFVGDLPYNYDLAELGRYWKAYDDLMKHWAEILPPGVMIDVQYEKVVDDVETQARRMLSHCGLDWDDACLQFHKTERNVYTASASQVRQPIYKSSVNKWKAYGETLRPLLDALGIKPGRLEG